jgi:hypothetical protein
VEAIKFLVAVGAHVSSTASPTQDSPLHLAVRFSHQDAVLVRIMALLEQQFAFFCFLLFVLVVDLVFRADFAPTRRKG